MSNYYKCSADLSKQTQLKVICNSITNADIKDNYLNLDIINGNTTFTSDINEKPAILGYEYKGTDISTYAIAAYIESPSTLSIPDWCNKIRVILVGGGGSGGKGTVGTTQNQETHNDGQFKSVIAQWHQSLYDGQEEIFVNFEIKNTIYTNKSANKEQILVHAHTTNTTFVNNENFFRSLYDEINSGNANWDTHTPISTLQNDEWEGGNSYDHETYYVYSATATEFKNEHYTYVVPVIGLGGAGGGGGAFLYLETPVTATNRNNITLTTVGSSTSTTITISGNTYTASAGTSATTNTKGTGGGISGNVILSKAGTDGTAATTSTGGAGGISGLLTYSSILTTYGNGGSGSAGVYKDETPSDGISGQTGYYRIYYLTD